MEITAGKKREILITSKTPPWCTERVWSRVDAPNILNTVLGSSWNFNSKVFVWLKINNEGRKFHICTNVSVSVCV